MKRNIKRFFIVKVSTAAGSAIGHVVGRTVMNAFEGNSSSSEPQQEQEQPQQYSEQSSFGKQNQGSYLSEDDRPCKFEDRSFQQCLGSNSNQIAPCQWAFDLLKDCQGSLQKEGW